MNPLDLLTSFRRDVADVATPPLWSDAEVYEYMNWAIDQFCIGWGGFVDSSSSITKLRVVAGQAFAAFSTRILKINAAFRVSDFAVIKVLNIQNMMREWIVDDYGFALRDVYDTKPGPIFAMITNMEPDKVRWVQVPVANDVVQLSVYRLALDPITCAGKGTIEVADEFLRTILLGMKSQAYMKQDAETFDKSKAEDFETKFIQYVAQAKTVRDTRESKVRLVRYGGVGGI